jgi:hypothetical protein
MKYYFTKEENRLLREATPQIAIEQDDAAI